MRRALATATAVLWLGIAGFAPAATAEPRPCDSDTAPNPFPAPDGTTFVVHHESRSGTSTLTSPVLDGDLPRGCTLDHLGYDRTDGYLYGLHDSAIVRIGRAASGEVAAATVGALPDTPLVGDIDRGGRYVAFDFVPLTGTGTVHTYDSFPLPVPEASTVRWDNSCDRLLANQRAQARLRAKNPSLPAPEPLIEDWAYNPADGKLYGYASVDAHDAYLGKVEPLSKWTVAPLPDQVIRVSPALGTARCAPASNPHPPGGIDRGVIGDTYGSDANHGSAGIGGVAFTGPDRLALFQLAQGQRWFLDVGACFTPAGCVPEPDGPAPDGHGDAAGSPYQPARVTVQTVADKDAPRRQRFSFASEDLDPNGFILGPGESRTFDLAPGEVQLAKAPTVTGWHLEHIGCQGTDSPGKRDATDPTRVVLGPGEQLVCTYAARMLMAAPAPSSSPAQGAGAPQGRQHGDSTALRKTSAGRPGIEFSLPWNPQTAVSLPGTGNPLITVAALLILALGIGGGVFILFPRRRGPAPPPYRARHRA
jgi:hypothetical protein